MKNEAVRVAADRLTTQIMGVSNLVRLHSAMCKIEHHDGEIKITRWGDIATYSRTVAADNITTWHNGLFSRSQVYQQVFSFVEKCAQLGLCVDVA